LRLKNGEAVEAGIIKDALPDALDNYFIDGIETPVITSFNAVKQMTDSKFTDVMRTEGRVRRLHEQLKSAFIHKNEERIRFEVIGIDDPQLKPMLDEYQTIYSQISTEFFATSLSWSQKRNELER
jgi:hypothetical protein